MATVEEVLAKADKWEAAGNPENAAKLRAYAETLKPKAGPTRAEVEAKAAAWEKTGNTENAAKLRAYAETLPAEEVTTPEPAKPDVGPVVPARADEEDPAARDARLVAMFEAANPRLAGKYKTAAELPKVGETIPGANVRERTTVQPWQNVKEDTFGETALAMTEGPMASAEAFAAGLGDSAQSPSRAYLANDPATRNLPSWMLTGMGKVGDLGGAALSTFGAGLSGAAGLLSEVVPGQNSANEKKFAEDLTGMAMFATPELAGVSSVPARMATAAPKSAPAAVAKAAPNADAIAAAERYGIPVMRTDVKPPETFIGKVAQKTGESIPIAGTSGMRAKQAAARGDAVTRFIDEYVGVNIGPAIDTVTESLTAANKAFVEKWSKQKNAVIDGLKGKGTVPVDRTVAMIDSQIAKLSAAKNEGFAPIIKELEAFKKSITDQALPEIDMNRAYIGGVFKGMDASKIKDAGEKALTAIYGPLKQDMADFIAKNGGDAALKAWNAANEKLAENAGTLKNSALKSALAKGDLTPEVTSKLLFSQKPSELRMLESKLNDEGRKAARVAIVQEAVKKATDANGAVSVDRFKTAMARMGNQVDVFFKGDDYEAATGLVKALQLTERGARAADAPPTGIQNMPALAGLGLGGIFGLYPAVGVGMAAGAVARIYEATGVKSALRQVAKAKTPRESAMAMQKLDGAMREVAVPAAAQAANSDAPPAYEALFGRY